MFIAFAQTKSENINLMKAIILNGFIPLTRNTCGHGKKMKILLTSRFLFSVKHFARSQVTTNRKLL